jgi:hypothetical protein
MKALPLKGSTSHVRTNKREQINADLECQKSLPNQVKALHNRLMEKLTLVTGPSGAEVPATSILVKSVFIFSL